MLRQALVETADGLGIWRLTRLVTRASPRVFMFHRFRGTSNESGLLGHDFRLFIERVSREYELVTVATIIDLLGAGKRIVRPLAAITVDDGYADFHEVALPVLRELNVPATIYATAGFIDRQCWLWWDALRYVIDGHPGGAVELRLGSENITLHLSDARSRQVAWNDVADRLVTRNHLRATAIREIARAGGLVLPDTPTAAYEAMTWDQLREAAAAGVEVGGHTMTHAFLPGLDSESLQAEIVGGRALLERRLGVSIRTFAYPNGMPYDVDPAVEAAVRSAGFQAAVVAYPRVFCRNQMFQIGRWSVDPHSQMLEHVLSGASEIKLRFKH